MHDLVLSLQRPTIQVVIAPICLNNGATWHAELERWNSTTTQPLLAELAVGWLLLGMNQQAWSAGQQLCAGTNRTTRLVAKTSEVRKCCFCFVPRVFLLQYSVPCSSTYAQAPLETAGHSQKGDGFSKGGLPGEIV